MPASSSSLIPPQSAAAAKLRLGLALGSNPDTQARLRLVQGQELVNPVTLRAPPAAAPQAPKVTRLGKLRQRLDRLTLFRHAILGGVIEVMDGVRQFMAPAAFVARNALWVAIGLLTVGVPVAIAFLLWRHVPGWSIAFPLRSPLSWAFLAGLSVALGFVGLVIAVLGRAAVRGIRQGGQRLSDKGVQAFD